MSKRRDSIHSNTFTVSPGEQGLTTVIPARFRLLLVAALAIALSGCGLESESDLQGFVAQVKARQKGKIPPLPEAREFAIFSYNEEVLRDPFIPAEVVEAAARSAGKDGLRPDLDRQRDLLEQFSLGSLKLMGSLEKDGTRWALVRSADGTLHRTTKGRYMGHNNGEIIAINESNIELREIIPDGLGGWVEKFTTLSTDEE